MIPQGPRDDTAITPLVGVVLMLAITVTVVAIAIPLVLTQSNAVTDDQPTVDLGYSYTEDVDSGATDVFGLTADNATIDADGQLTIIFESGDTVPADRLSISGVQSSGNLTDSDSFAGGETVTQATEVTVWASRGETVQVRWTAEDDDESALLGTFTVRPTS
ncbi:type IV pilin [Halovenus salina]|uniref:Type IV pilin n=1 Tax=Halovenus salina TaxID=1510225 RepID=A0ABD5W1U5_9EURY|nr:type IV pilin [Halovenus salina]